MEILLGLLIVALVGGFVYTRRTKETVKDVVAEPNPEPIVEVKPAESAPVVELVKKEPVSEQPKTAAKKPKATKTATKKVVQMPKKPAVKKPKTTTSK